MFSKKDKRTLYSLIDEYIKGQIDSLTFESEYIECYNIELDEQLSDLEEKVFSQLNDVVSRFSPFEKDLKNYPGVYYSEAEMKVAVLKAKEELKECLNDSNTSDKVCNSK